ncbi:cAMP-specific 3',5'-cyclic phosphodiesterase 4D-like [Mauremys mutica]|uniref:cAMP-specific 3',5'-cyclic phosphodiesterase 4D-like n=1 Tax=Mauremys mutica TaxID=74926 RepID=UPI001D168430|nr:cAMP-specific 3',5'-cyclic phosphodiesterase 4D-like [Mauremys mutica]
MNKNTGTLHVRSKSISEETLHSNTEDEGPFQGMEPYLVRRLSCRNIQLPPLAFRQLEQADWDKKSDMETIPRPTSLPLRSPPLIAITSAEASRFLKLLDCEDSFIKIDSVGLQFTKYTSQKYTTKCQKYMHFNWSKLIKLNILKLPVIYAL